jgi:hypothetical protein
MAARLRATVQADGAWGSTSSLDSCALTIIAALKVDRPNAHSPEVELLVERACFAEQQLQRLGSSGDSSEGTDKWHGRSEVG